jgi:hypothetical protein
MCYDNKSTYPVATRWSIFQEQMGLAGSSHVAVSSAARLSRFHLLLCAHLCSLRWGVARRPTVMLIFNIFNIIGRVGPSEHVARSKSHTILTEEGLLKDPALGDPPGVVRMRQRTLLHEVCIQAVPLVFRYIPRWERSTRVTTPVGPIEHTDCC